MNSDHTAIICKHVEAVSAMLLGNRALKPGAAITAGDPIDIVGRSRLAQVAQASNTDFVHLQFAEVGGHFCMTNICIVVPRDGVCFSQPDCRLYLSKSGSRGVILPRAGGRGSFRLSPGEILHVDRTPDDAEAGFARAAAHLHKLVGRGVCIDGRFELTVVPLAV